LWFTTCDTRVYSGISTQYPKKGDEKEMGKKRSGIGIVKDLVGDVRKTGGQVVKETQPGAVDDNATKRVIHRKKRQSDIMRELFDDNETDRYSDSIDE
jgi:hypothetical protein